MELQINGQQGRDLASTRGAEGANLEQAKPDETLRQKDPVTASTLESLIPLRHRRCKVL